MSLGLCSIFLGLQLRYILLKFPSLFFRVIRIFSSITFRFRGNCYLTFTIFRLIFLSIGVSLRLVGLMICQCSTVKLVDMRPLLCYGQQGRSQAVFPKNTFKTYFKLCSFLTVRTRPFILKMLGDATDMKDMPTR